MQDVSKSYGKRTVLQGFSLNVNAGEMVALCGASGCGKSTLLNILGLLERLDLGSYALFGKSNIKPGSMSATRCIRENISYLFQNYALVDNMTVKENLLFALRYVAASGKDKLAAICESLAQVGLDGCLNARVCELSGGEQLRVALARCIIKPGGLILADEPTGSLDSGNRDNVMQLLKGLNRQGKTIVMVTHDPAAAAFCDRVIQIAAVENSAECSLR
ncbi:MAG: ABC transporter ATP-binding protein [Coriobacteriales bacterium]|jgi:putative ABC transport system ATP-binding protein|nr:ABC transporter ATP-binding protein [Coriobacteriales bacterium]